MNSNVHVTKKEVLPLQVKLNKRVRFIKRNMIVGHHTIDIQNVKNIIENINNNITVIITNESVISVQLFDMYLVIINANNHHMVEQILLYVLNYLYEFQHQ
ncbi:hypothetical protein DERP_006048 [Dermatophagoides pteronyssinus]|uniref:Uncharacterized protein n=1 Tax=Dermatophagoides pteronyssinus TaxID=6956 RepID=A0ABQ8JSR9_DERPT|nr:hypothetical protein DERP_006048 [Dermatophagoides pteronyssinus]